MKKYIFFAVFPAVTQSIPIENKTDLKCDVKLINSAQIHVAFIGVFHGTWMSNLKTHENTIYVTKSYRGNVI